jgi:hypothetical protein
MTRRPEVEEDVLARVIQLYRATGGKGPMWQQLTSAVDSLLAELEGAEGRKETP